MYARTESECVGAGRHEPFPTDRKWGRIEYGSGWSTAGTSAKRRSHGTGLQPEEQTLRKVSHLLNGEHNLPIKSVIAIDKEALLCYDRCTSLRKVVLPKSGIEYSWFSFVEGGAKEAMRGVEALIPLLRVGDGRRFLCIKTSRILAAMNQVLLICTMLEDKEVDGWAKTFCCGG